MGLEAADIQTAGLGLCSKMVARLAPVEADIALLPRCYSGKAVVEQVGKRLADHRDTVGPKHSTKKNKSYNRW